MKPLSQQLKGYTGANPFHESQARTFGDDKVVMEFYPTSLYWSLFNEQHEILIGTRGSGKTVILKMLSYSCLRRFGHDQAHRYATAKSFIGFYIPLHLEFMAALPGDDTEEDDRIRFFQFAVNCAACKALLSEVQDLLTDCFPGDRDRLVAESRIVDHLMEMWDPLRGSATTSLRQLQRGIDLLYVQHKSFTDDLPDRAGVFSKPLFSPIMSVLPALTQDLGLNVQNTNWLACIDEAEFLTPPYIKCINTFMRSEKRPLVVKMATLPFKHSTRETLIAGVSIQPDGNDFNYRCVDTEADSDDFKSLCDHLCSIRMVKCGVTDQNVTLGRFLGLIGNDDLVDYFRLELDRDATDSCILDGILSALSPERQSHLKDIPHSDAEMRQPYFKKFAPVYFARRMRAENSRGNRTVGWFAGAATLRRVADGNPRRFIQVMNDMVEAARNQDLTPKNQHRVLVDYCARSHRASEGLPELGLVVKELLDTVGQLLAQRVHGTYMVNGGCEFTVDNALLEDRLFRRAVELAVAYSLVVTDRMTLTTGISRESELRLSYLYAVLYWLPMRRGDAFTVRSKHRRLCLDAVDPSKPLTSREAKAAVVQLQLEGIDGPSTDTV